MTASPHPLQFSELAVSAALLGGVALTFVPTLNSQFTLPKLSAFYPLLALATIVWAVRYRRGGTSGIPLPVGVVSASLLIWWIATLPFAVDFRTSLWGASGRGNGLVLHIALLGLFAGIAAMRIGADGIRRLLRAMLAIVAVVSAYAVVQAAGLDLFVWPNVRPGSTIGHPVPLAAILALGVPIGLAMAASSRTRKTLAVVGAVTALMVFALGTTLSRGPWIGVVCGTAVTIALMLRVSGGQRSRMAAISAAAVIAVGATVWLARVPGTRVTQRIALIARATTDPSFMNRFEYFSAALAMIRQRPVTGSGFETFGLLFPPLRPVENLTVDEDTIPTMVHNGYLDRSVWTGSPGLLLYVALMAVVGAVLVQAIRRRENTNGDDRRMLACGILGGLVAFWIQDLSGWEEVSSSVFFWVVAGLGVCLSAHSEDVQFDARGHKPTSVNRRVASVALALCALLLGACSWTVWRETYADAQITGARRIGVGSGWREARAILEETRPLVAHDASSLDRIAVVYLDRLRATPDPEAYRTVRDVLREAGASTRFNPYVLVHVVDAETLALLSGLTRTVSNEAVDAALRAAELDPNNATVHEALARFYMASGHASRALEEIHAALALRPNRDGLRMLEGDILRAAGDKRAALEAYRAEVRRHADGNPVWIAAQQKVTASVIEAGDYVTALRESEILVGKAPADPTNWSLLDAARALRTY